MRGRARHSPRFSSLHSWPARWRRARKAPTCTWSTPALSCAAADTPQKLERLRRLPPLKFVARTRNGQRYFLYADPDVCKCLFVGNAAALKAYRDMRALPAPAGNVAPRGVVPEAMMIDDINSDDDALFGGDDFFGLPF